MNEPNRQVAMITGSGGNLGSAVARAFRAAGAKLALVDRHEDILHRIFPDLVDDPDCYMSGCADLTDPEEVQRVVDGAVDAFGRIDVLVNTVGGYRAGAPLHETELSTWRFMLELNAGTVFITSRTVIPQMISQERGKIINLAARPGLSGTAGGSAYSASKAAVIRLTESASEELKDKGINVNCLLPGTIDTPENREAMTDADFSQWVEPESLAAVILFLASDAARDIHGAAIPVYGLSG
ncbi:MAG: SDR family NAD(P)-dependent oxidoreductase [Candidatus Promineifilaceae bacterium]|nr:SDR family NAD(P)-dependent oxidoreductase [Candidatus Promineifilaceae bacterium]